MSDAIGKDFNAETLGIRRKSQNRLLKSAYEAFIVCRLPSRQPCVLVHLR